MHHSLKTMPTHSYLPYQGWALLNFHHYFSLRNIAPFSFYLPHPETFFNNSLHLSEEAILSNHGDMTFLDIVLPIHNFTYIQAYRAKSVKLRQPNWYLLIHPSHNIHHFIVYHLNFIEIPTNCFIMIYPIAQATEFV